MKTMSLSLLDHALLSAYLEATDNQGEVIQTARERCCEHLRAGRAFAFNATNITRQMRRRWIELFADYAARMEVVYVEPPFAILD